MTSPHVRAHLARLTLAGYRPRTIEARHRVLHTFEQHSPNLLNVTRYDVEAFLARPLAPESRRAYRSHLRGFYTWLVEEGVLSSDPTERVPTIRIPKAQPRPISLDDLRVALAAAQPRMRAWLLLMSLGGLRCCEVSPLRPQDLLDLDGIRLLYLREVKGGGSATVPAHPLVLAALAVLPVEQQRWWKVSPHGVGVLVAEHLRSVGCDATAHQLRHFAGTAWYRESGHDLLTTARLLRHVNVATTQIYAELDPTRPAAVVAGISL